MDYYQFVLPIFATYIRPSVDAIPMGLDDAAPDFWDDDLMALAALQISPAAGPSALTSETIAPPELFAAFLLGASPSPAPAQYNFIEPIEDETEEPSASGHDVSDPPIAPPPAADLTIAKRRYTTPDRYSMVDPSRRRKKGNVKVEGQKFGRGGVPRCALCRKHRQKVIPSTFDGVLTECSVFTMRKIQHASTA
jgi:hypothetical protein